MSGEKTEQASQRRLEKARADGRSPVSRDASMLAGLSAGLVVLAAQADSTSVARWLTTALQQTRYEGAQTFSSAGRAVLMAAGPPAAAGLAAFAAATLLQTGFLIHGAALQPDLSRISPLSGIKRVLSPQTLVQLGKSLVKLGVMAACLYTAFRRLVPELLTMPGATPGAILHHAASHARSLVFLLLGAQAVIAGADVAWERLRHMRQLRMSLQELRDEHKESEGNPQIKQRLRQLARSRRRRRMMLAVPKASVVITNPTHYAVALAYERGAQGAPRIVAKGADEVAARIRELAREHRVPIVANPPLARALFRVEIDTEIPAEHFKAVAEVIAFVWRLRTRPGRL